MREKDPQKVPKLRIDNFREKLLKLIDYIPIEDLEETSSKGKLIGYLLSFNCTVLPLLVNRRSGQRGGYKGCSHLL